MWFSIEKIRKIKITIDNKKLRNITYTRKIALSNSLWS